MSYSVKLADEILISGFSAIQPNYLLSHHRIIAENQSDDSMNAVISTGGSPEVAFDLTHYIGKKGLRFHDRSSKLTLAAVKAMLEETNLLERYPNRDVNLVVGSDGALQSQNDVVREAMLSPSMVNPKAYPNRGCNVIAGQASLMFGVLGESTVISSGYRSGLDALIYAVRKILVASRPVSYIVAAGEALSDARTLRKKHKTCADSHYSLPIEGAVALSVERAIDELPQSNLGVQVIGYQQINTQPMAIALGQGATKTHADAILQEFLSQFGYCLETIDVLIVGLEDRLYVKTTTGVQVVAYDAFGATGLLQLVETLGLKGANDVGSNDQPEMIAIGHADQHGGMSMLLLRKNLN